MQKVWAVSLGIVFLMLMGCGGNAGPNGSGYAQHVVIVVLEGHSFQQVIGNPSMPYLNELAAQHGVVPNYFADQHGPLADILAITTGRPYAVSSDASYSGIISDDNVVRELASTGRTWKGYFQGLPGPGYLGETALPYSTSQNPFVYLSDVVEDANQAANMVPLRELAHDWATDSLPNFALIVPDQEHNGNSCPAASIACTNAVKLKAADDWLRENIAPLLADQNFQSSGDLLIVFDQGAGTDIAGGGANVPVVAIGKNVGAALAQAPYVRPEDLFRFVLSRLGVAPYETTSSHAAAVSTMVRNVPMDCPGCEIPESPQPSDSTRQYPLHSLPLSDSQRPAPSAGSTRNIIPDVDGSLSLGSSNHRWKVSATSISADSINHMIVVDGTTYPRTVAGIKAAVDALGGRPGVVLLTPPESGNEEYGDDGATTISVTGIKQNIIALGRWSPAIAVAPGRTKPLFVIGSQSGRIHFFGSLGGFAIDATNHKAGFTAIKLINVSKILIHDIDVLNDRGGGTIGIEIQGQDFIKIERCNIAADQPIKVDKNPYNPPNFDFDQVSFDALELYPGNAYYGISIGPDISVTNFSIHNMDVAGGKGALSWVDHGHPTTASLMMTVVNARHEQGKDPSAYSWYIDRSGASYGAYGITFQDVGAAAEENGFYFRNVQKVTLIDVQSPRKGAVALNADKSAYDVHVIAPMFAEGSVIKDASVSNSASGVDYFPNDGAIRTGSVNSRFFLDVGSLIVRKGNGMVGGSIATTTDHPARSGSLRLAEGEAIAWRNKENSSDIRLGTDYNDRLAVDGAEIPTLSSTDELSNKTLIGPVVHSPKITDPTFENLGSASHVICWKTSSTLGYCSTKPDQTGSCTCN